MNEPLTSNPILAKIKERHEHATGPSTWGTAEKDIHWLLGHVERLTAALAGTKDELYSVDKAAKELGGELDATKAVATYNRDMADRLRALLRALLVCDAGPHDWCYFCDAHKSAITKALAGVIRTPRDEYKQPSETQAIPCESSQEHRAQPVETTVIHGCFCHDYETGVSRDPCPIHGPPVNGEGSL